MASTTASANSTSTKNRRPPVGRSTRGRVDMMTGFSARALTLAATLLMTFTGARAFDDAKYPDLKGAWDRSTNPRWVLPGDKPAPLTAEYQAVYDANLAAQARRGAR